MHLLPRPLTVTALAGSFVLDHELTIAGDPRWAAAVRRLLSPGTGLALPSGPDGRLILRNDPALRPEHYRLEITPEAVSITAADEAGVNWATQTFRQLLGADVLRAAPLRNRFEVAGVRVDDGPRFSWRGVMLDVARHFMPLSDLFRFVDLLALHKYNVFHLHLAEDQGWRFASQRYPRLQEVASWRSETWRHLQDFGDGTPHGGYYTQDQLRSLARYAADRAITIVPELEFPGHVRGVLAAYPELGNHPDRPSTPATTFGVFDEVLNLSDAAMALVFDLYAELLDVFPSRYIHVGGDEVRTTEWETSEQAGRLAAERGLPGPQHLQRWFTGQLRDWLADHGRVLVGWDEICDDGPVPGAVAMAWRDVNYAVRAAAAGMDVVMAPLSHTYFDYYPSNDADEAYAIGWLTTTQHVYTHEPLNDMPPDCHAKVLGTQCQLWTEYMPNTRRVDYMMFPRACAHAEVAWSDPTHRSWSEFEGRLGAHLQRLEALGVSYRPESGPLPWQRGGTGALARPREHR